MQPPLPLWERADRLLAAATAGVVPLMAGRASFASPAPLFLPLKYNLLHAIVSDLIELQDWLVAPNFQ